MDVNQIYISSEIVKLLVYHQTKISLFGLELGPVWI